MRRSVVERVRTGLSVLPKLRIVQFDCIVVGEHSVQRGSIFVRICGAYRRENVGMSSDKTGEKPVRRKPKVSTGRVIRGGLVGP